MIQALLNDQSLGPELRTTLHTLHVACAVNRPYVFPLAVTLKSLVNRLRPDFKVVFYLIHSGIPEHSLAAISSIVETHPVVPANDQLRALPRDARFPREAALPLLLAEILPPALERVLFLDADTLVLGDLADLWQTPLDQHVLAAAPDGAVPFCSSPRGVKGWRALGIPQDSVYFNCGVLLIHLARWRERDVTRRAMQYLETTREPIDFLHHEALNAALWNDWKRLDSRWNLLASRAQRPYGEARAEDASKPGIVHFAGRMKPWRAPVGGPFNATYQEILEQVLPLIAPEPPALLDRFCSLYDRYLRGSLFPVEQFLWRRRLI